MNLQFNFRDRPLVDEMRPHFLSKHELDKRRLQMLLLEHRIAEFNKVQEQAVNKARVWA